MEWTEFSESSLLSEKVFPVTVTFGEITIPATRQAKGGVSFWGCEKRGGQEGFRLCWLGVESGSGQSLLMGLITGRQ